MALNESLLSVGTALGFTTRSVEDRVKEINSATGVVFPFSARRIFAVGEARHAERRVFSVLEQYRIRSDREFFKVTYVAAIRALEDCLYKGSHRPGSYSRLLRARGTARLTLECAPARASSPSRDSKTATRSDRV